MKRNGLPFVAREFRHRQLNSRSIGPKVVSYDTKAGANQQQFVAEKLKIKQLMEYKAFKDLGLDAAIPEGHTKIPVHFVYDIKHDG